MTNRRHTETEALLAPKLTTLCKRATSQQNDGFSVARSKLEWRGHDFKSAAHVATLGWTEVFFDQMGRFKSI